MYHHLVALVSVDLTTDNFRSTLRIIDCLVGFLTDQPGDRYAFRRTQIDGWKRCQLPHPLITWTIYQRIQQDAYWRKKIDCDGDGPCLFQISYININLSINWSILWLIGRTKWKEGQISTKADIRTHYLTDISTERHTPLLTDTNKGVTKTGRVYFQSETSIFTYWSIDQSIDLSMD